MSEVTVAVGTDSQLISLVIVVVKKKKVPASLSIGLVTTKEKINTKGRKVLYSGIMMERPR